MPVRLECRSHLGEYTAKPNLPADASVSLFLRFTIKYDNHRFYFKKTGNLERA